MCEINLALAPANLCWPCQPAAACTAARSCGSFGAFRFAPVAPEYCRGSLDLCLAFGTKLSLLGFLVVRTVQNSPCMQKKRQIEPFRVSRESFVPEVGPCGSCWESFVPKRHCVVLVGRNLFRRGTFRVCSCRASDTHRRPSLALGSLRCAPCRWRWGFAALGAGCRRVAGVSRL